MRYLIAADAEYKEGVLCTETGIVLRKQKTDGEITSLLESLTDNLPTGIRQTAVHIALSDTADGADCEALENTIKENVGNKTTIACENRMVHRILSEFESGESGILLYVSPHTGAGRIYDGGLAVLGGVGAPLYGQGSAYSLGENVIRAAMAAAEKTGPPTVLTSLLEDAAGLPIGDIKKELAGMKAEKIAAYGRLAAKGKMLEDAVSCKIWMDMIEALGFSVRALAFKDEKVSVKVTCVPPLFEPCLSADLSQFLGERFFVSVSEKPLFLGGIKRAAEMLGISPDEKFVNTFLETYKNFSI